MLIAFDITITFSKSEKEDKLKSSSELELKSKETFLKWLKNGKWCRERENACYKDVCFDCYERMIMPNSKYNYK